MKPRALLQAACLAGSARAALWARGYNNNTTATNINNSYSNSNTMGGGRSVNATAPVHVNNTAATTANDNNTTPDKSGVEDIGSGSSSSSSSSSSTDDLSSAVGVTATLGGYTIPRDLPDGHYTIALHPTGTALHTRRWHAPSRRWHPLHRRAGGTGEYSFLVDDAHLRLEAVSQDSHAQQRVPLPADKLQCHCLHQRAYSPLNYPLPPQDYYASKQELFNWCNTFGWQGHHVSMALGGSVAVSGDTVVVGAPGDDDAGTDSGSAYVFARTIRQSRSREQPRAGRATRSWASSPPPPRVARCQLVDHRAVLRRARRPGAPRGAAGGRRVP